MYVLQNNNQQQREIESKSNHTLLTDPRYEEENRRKHKLADTKQAHITM